MADPVKKKRLTPLQGDEAASEGTATGKGGESRRRDIDSIVDNADSGKKKKREAQSTDSNNRY